MSQAKLYASKSIGASQLRQKKYMLIRQYGLPENLLGGRLLQTYRRCGKTNCHCKDSQGHVAWTLRSRKNGRQQAKHVNRNYLQDVQHLIHETQAYLIAIKDVMAINTELFLLTCQEQKVRGRKKT